MLQDCQDAYDRVSQLSHQELPVYCNPITYCSYLRNSRMKIVSLLPKSSLLCKVVVSFGLFPHIIESHTFPHRTIRDLEIETNTLIGGERRTYLIKYISRGICILNKTKSPSLKFLGSYFSASLKMGKQGGTSSTFITSGQIN